MSLTASMVTTNREHLTVFYLYDILVVSVYISLQTCVSVGNKKYYYCYHRAGALWWRHNGNDGVSNHQPHDCLLDRLFRHRWKKTWKLRVTVLCAGNSPVIGEFPHKWPVTRKKFPYDDVIMWWASSQTHIYMYIYIYASPALDVAMLFLSEMNHTPQWWSNVHIHVYSN